MKIIITFFLVVPEAVYQKCFLEVQSSFPESKKTFLKWNGILFLVNYLSSCAILQEIRLHCSVFSCKFNQFFKKNYFDLDFAKVRCEDSGSN